MRDELDLRLVDVAAFHASQSPVLKAGTRRDNALTYFCKVAARPNSENIPGCEQFCTDSP
jgi:hypothetical protein